MCGGALNLRTIEEVVVGSYISWQKDFPQEVSEMAKTFDEELSTSLTAREMFMIIYSAMVCELLMRVADAGHTKESPADAAFAEAWLTEAVSFTKFQTGHLGLTKKDVEKLKAWHLFEKLQKDLFWG